MDTTVVTDRLSQMGFRVYSSEEIKKLSVKEIRDPQQFDNLQLPTIGGLYDPALGCSRNDEVCTSCGQSGRYCPGHMGHIDLALPVFNPVFFKVLFKILKSSCLFCYRLLLKEEDGVLFVYQMRLLEKGLVLGAQKLQEYAWNFRAEKEEAFNSFKEELFTNLENMAREMLEEGSSAESAQHTKLVHAEVSRLVNDTLKLLAGAPRRCPHCKTEKLSLKSEYFSRIVASGHLTKKEKSKDQRKSSSGTPDEEEMMDHDGELNEVEHLLQSGRNQCLIMPHLALQILQKVLKKDGSVVRKLFCCLEEFGDDESAADAFFLSALLVPPSRFRPLSVMGDRKFENPQTANLSRVLVDNCEIRQQLTKMNFDLNKSTDLTDQEENGNTAMDNLRSLWVQLQSHVNALIDSDLDKLSPKSNKLQGIRQLLEKKEGLFRMHMMGKRVNYAARSVISPDVCINTNEIGVPMVFAQKLTYPQPVTPWNVHELRHYVINGPNNYPGASAVVNEDGSMTKLSPVSQTQREAVAKQLLTPSDASGRGQLPKQVLRHLKNGDVMLLNRQPTLHRPSIQAHKARVLPGLKTLRLHYSNCKAYNADFDGDEMNAHFPQSELGRAEAYGIAKTDFQYLVPKDGAPLAGLIQDHLVAGVALTVRGQFFNREDYCNLLQAALADMRGRLQLLPPTIMKPGPLWAGKQVISTLLLNIIPKEKPPLSLDSRAKISELSWVRTRVQDPWMVKVSKEELLELGESTVLVSHGELLQGVLDKAQCGPSSFGLVHYVYELYGGEVAGHLLTCLGRLFTAFLKLRGFTLGVEDILVKDKAERKRAKIITKSFEHGHKTALEAFGESEESCSDAQLLQLLREAQFGQDEFSMQKLDVTAKKATFRVQDDIVRNTMHKDLYKSFPDNNLQLMVQSGAKGSSVNCMQISGLLGQIELEGRRPPLMQSGRSLPSFMPYDLSLRSRGFVTGRFLTGIRPQEYFFHCMAGREGLVDTAVKTSRSGYLQRCLIKHLEGLSVKYDMTVRDSDGSVIQFLYGEDGLETTKTSLLEERQLPFLLKNQHVIGSHVDKATGSKHVEKYKKKITKWEKKHKGKKERSSAFLEFCCSRQHSTVTNGDAKLSEATGRSAHSKALEVEWRSLNPKKKNKLLKKHRRCPDPVISRFWPQQNCGVLSEKMQKSVNLIQKQLLEVGRSCQDMAKEEQSVVECDVLTKLVNYRVMRSLCEPGEAVGVLCAQSLGEQTTQMTLNTFHFAGRGEMNVTMGVPRLREVLMTASSTILTPSVDVPVVDTPEAVAAAKKLQMRMNRVCLNDVLEDIQVSDYLEAPTKGRKRLYRIRLVILPKKLYSDKLQMKPKAILKLLEGNFFRLLGESIYKAIRKQKKEPSRLVSQSRVHDRERTENQVEETVEAEAAADNADNADSDVEANDGDASTVKELQRHTDLQEYEGEEDERQEVGDSTQPDEMEVPEETPTDEDRSEHGDDTEAEEAESANDKGIAVLKSSAIVHDYTRDKKGRWCEVVYEFDAQRFLVNAKSIVEREAKKFTLQSVHGIKRCMLIERSEDERFKGQKRLYFVTEGINLMEMMKHFDILELNAMYTNSIVDIQNTYGIEAANKAIIKEVQTVFKAYNIQVNYRHLSLLADYMTCEGEYKGFNRMAINSNPSPLQKITFETSTNFLVNACLNAWPDQLQSPSAQIVAGRVVSSGTGSFEILQPLQI